jgi:hypothetical protein
LNDNLSDTRTPIEELRAAATRIREFAEGTTPADGDPSGWLGHADEETGHTFIFGGPVKDGYRTGTVFEFKDELDCEECNRPSPADLNWMWLMSPQLAEPLAEWLEHEAYMADRRGLSVEGNTFHAMKVARFINGTTK